MNPSEVDELAVLREEEAGDPLPPGALPAPKLSQAAPPAWNPRVLRLAYVLEFLIALIAIISLWSEVGGEGHLDLIPWYTKLISIAGLAWCSVNFTAALVEQQKVWTLRMVLWLAAIVLFCVAMGTITYYYHLHEQTDDQDDGDTTAAAVNIYRGNCIDHGGRRNRQVSIRFLARTELLPGYRMPAGGHGGDPGLRL